MTSLRAFILVIGLTLSSCEKSSPNSKQVKAAQLIETLKGTIVHGADYLDRANPGDDDYEFYLKIKNLEGNPPASGYPEYYYDKILGRAPTTDELPRIPSQQLPMDQLISELISTPEASRKLAESLLPIFIPANHSGKVHSCQVADELAANRAALSNEAKSIDLSFFQNWLFEQCQQNTGWDQLIYQIMSARGTYPEQPETGYLLARARNDNIPIEMGEITKNFLGEDHRCAQCHAAVWHNFKHIDYLRAAAIFSHTQFSDNRIEDHPDVINAVMVPADFKYIHAEPGTIVKPKFPIDGAAVLESPEKSRQSFATWLTSTDNDRFVANVANLLFILVFERAPKDPYPLEGNPPKFERAPKLMQHLQQIVIEENFDLQACLEILYLAEHQMRSGKAE